MSQYNLKDPPKRQHWADKFKTPQSLFPEIFNISNLKIDKQLPNPKINNYQTELITDEKQIDISVNVPFTKGNIDLYLFVDNKKKDLFYRIKNGDYIFKNIKLNKGKNIIELFYKIGDRRTSSIYSSIIRESKDS